MLMCIVSPRCSCLLLTSMSASTSYTYVYAHSLAFHNIPALRPYQHTSSLIYALQSYLCHLHWIREERRRTPRCADNLLVYKKFPVVTRYNYTQQIQTGFFCHSAFCFWKRALAWYRHGDWHSKPVPSNSPSKERDKQCKTHVEASIVVGCGFCVTFVVHIQDFFRSCTHQ
jgi:hypothetical protein